MKTIFIGYKHGGYKLYNSMTKKVIVSCDVTFAEDEEWQWNATAEMDSKKRYIYVLNDDVENRVTLEAPAAWSCNSTWSCNSNCNYDGATNVHLQDCEVNFDDEVDDNGDLVHFVFLAESEFVRLADAIQHPKWQKAMNEELIAIEKNNIMTQIGKIVPNQN